MMSHTYILLEDDNFPVYLAKFYSWVLALIIITHPRPNHDNIIIRGAFYYNAHNDEEPFI